MWIGYPWDLREVRNGAKGLRRNAVLNANEHVSLSGAIRTTSRRMTRHRWSVDLPWLSEVEADWIRYLAQKLDGPGPIVMIEPSTRNYLGARQSLGRAAVTEWAPTVGSLAVLTNRIVQWTRPSTGSLRWVNRVWARWPVKAGMPVTFTHAAAGAGSGIEWFTAAGVSISTSVSGTGTVTDTAPATATWFTPFLSATGAGSLVVPRACLNYATAANIDVPGEHVGAFGITDASDLLEVLPSRSVSIELVEF